MGNGGTGGMFAQFSLIGAVQRSPDQTQGLNSPGLYRLLV